MLVRLLCTSQSDKWVFLWWCRAALVCSGLHPLVRELTFAATATKLNTKRNIMGEFSDPGSDIQVRISTAV